MYSDFINWFSTTALGTAIVKYFASPLDPIIFRLTNGRFTSTGAPTLPMLTLTTIGRKSGKPRAVQLAFIEDGGDSLVVASAMGQARHPGWMHNLVANPDVEVRVRGGVFPATATMLSDAEKARVWPAIKEVIPQMNVYENRTKRNIRIFRLQRTRSE